MGNKQKRFTTVTGKDVVDALAAGEWPGSEYVFGRFGGTFFEDMFDRPAIYFLLDTAGDSGRNFVDSCVYVGQTTHLLSRICQHRYGRKKTQKTFNEFSYVFVDREELNFVEALYISALEPKYNMQLAGRVETPYGKTAWYWLIDYWANGTVPEGMDKELVEYAAWWFTTHTVKGKENT